ncbi:hypothetical protein CIFRCK366B_20910 [Citrobacter freundii]
MANDPIMFWQAVLVLAVMVMCIIYNVVFKKKK